MIEGKASEHIIMAMQNLGIGIIFKQEGQVSMPGVPDIYMEDDKGSIWVEVKLVKKYPKRGSSKILTHDFDIAQINFFNKTKSRAFAIIADISEDREDKKRKISFRVLKKEDVKKNITLDEFKKFNTWEGEKFWE